MERHSLLERRPSGDLLEVVSKVCGLHAQVMSSAELTLWARLDRLSPEALPAALWEERSLVKLWAMRGTLHLLPAAELGTWLAALGTYEHYLKPVWLRNFEITRDELAQLVDAIGSALDGELRTREELAREVARSSGVPRMGERIRGSWGPYLKPASFQGRLCFGPGEGQKVRFTTPGSWLRSDLADPASDDALAEVTRRYLGAYAPATREDFARWWGVRPAQAGQMLRALADEAVEVDVDGERGYWILTEHVGEAAAAKPRNTARLLPGFDQWVVGASRNAAALLDPEHKARVYRPQGWISPVLLVNGRMEGVWRHDVKGARLRVEIEPFVTLPAWARKQLTAEAGRLADFLERELELGWRD